MHSILSGFLPIWTITALGWAAARTGVLGEQAQPVLGRFAFTFAMPALLFLTLSRSDIGDLADPGVVVFAVSLLVVFATGLLLTRTVFRRRRADQAIGGMAAAYVNSANLGIPVAVHVLGNASFVVAAALFQMLFVTPLIMLLIDLDVEGGRLGQWRRMLRLPLRNPVIAASAVGTAVAAIGRPLPEVITTPVGMLGGAGVPAALFALGMSLNTRVRPTAEGRAERLLLVGLKILVQPLLAYALGRWLFRLDGHALYAVVLCAGLPTAQNTFVYASEYRLHTDLARDTVVWSTVLSMASLSLIAWLLA